MIGANGNKKPAHVRNFWIETETGHRKPQATGPEGREGWFMTTVQVRYNGKPHKALEIVGEPDPTTGDLMLTVKTYRPDGSTDAFVIPFEE